MLTAVGIVEKKTKCACSSSEPLHLMPLRLTPNASESPPPSTPRTCGNARPRPTPVGNVASRAIADSTSLAASSTKCPAWSVPASSAIAPSGVVADSSGTISSGAEKRAMPDLCSPLDLLGRSATHLAPSES